MATAEFSKFAGTLSAALSQHYLSGFEIAQLEFQEVKCKGEKERYKHLNAEFQRIARRDKKPFLSNQCKEIKEKNRMGKTRDLFKKIRDTKGIFHAKMGSIKDRNAMDLTEISPGTSLEEMMLKLKLQYFGHLMRRADSLENTLLLGGIGGRRRRG